VPRVSQHTVRTVAKSYVSSLCFVAACDILSDRPFVVQVGARCAVLPCMPRVTKLGWLAQFDPQQARASILEAIEKTQGNVNDAADVLEVSSRMLRRYVNDLGLVRDLENLRQRLGVNWERDAPIRARARAAGELDGPRPGKPQKKASGIVALPGRSAKPAKP
jgi:hypothetical protein